MQLSEWVNPRALVRTLTSPAYLGTMALCGIGLWAADRYASGAWRNLRFVFMGALGAGVGYGVLAPLFPPLARGVVSAAMPVGSAQAAPANSRNFEPAQGVESSGVFIGQ